MLHDKTCYDELSSEELYDEIQGLDKEIANCQGTITKVRKALRQKQELQDTLIDIWTRKSTLKGWQR